MAKVKPRGSIILEILIVILIVALVATILYPKMVWNEAEKNTEICRKNMDRILKAELVYLKYHNNYEDTLDKVINFIQEDTTGQLTLEYLYSDTALTVEILNDLTNKDTVADLFIKRFLADTLVRTILFNTKYDTNLAGVILKRLETTNLRDSVVAARNVDSTEIYSLTRVANHNPPLEIVEPLQKDDSLKIVLQRIAPDISKGALVDTLYSNPKWAEKIDSVVAITLEGIKICPTNEDPYQIMVEDTTVIKVLNIYCPIDSADIEQSKQDFVKYFLGHLRLDNHGNIEAGEKSWLIQQ
ncbi:hypothetical protein GF337_18515 [candidate division KSB1 bacterium]|nr:hypothetical protein [candidate division KSB1 bacterium]